MEQIFTSLFYVFLSIATINVAFYIFFFVFAFAKEKSNSSSTYPPVSVIICAKNEAENLLNNLPKILAQDYPEFEVVLINDASQDDTAEIMEDFQEIHGNVQYIKVAHNERFWGKKKYALTLGIRRASYKHLLFTDADCYPSTRNWIRNMTSAFENKKGIILGYGAYKKNDSSFLNMLIRFETVLTAIQYFSYAIAGRPYMGVGRNLAYTSDIFYNQNGFTAHMNVQSGDDDLFVNSAATKENTAIQFSPESFTVSEPKRTLQEWITQKRRHITTSHHYRKVDAVVLGMFYLSQLAFLLLSLVLLASSSYLQWVTLTIALRYLIAWTSVGLSAHKLGERDMIWLFPILESILIITQLSIFITNRFSKSSSWK